MNSALQRGSYTIAIQLLAHYGISTMQVDTWIQNFGGTLYLQADLALLITSLLPEIYLSITSETLDLKLETRDIYQENVENGYIQPAKQSLDERMKEVENHSQIRLQSCGLVLTTLPSETTWLVLLVNSVDYAEMVWPEQSEAWKTTLGNSGWHGHNVLINLKEMIATDRVFGSKLIQKETLEKLLADTRTGTMVLIN